ncbi:hypothetical protein [Caballeronia sp. Lep1P3]|uniref:hypothetical protein n=1 Tax=Caballeronia sp. Lep1P3 TaxID=2878150 RepID=UPI001FD4C065|nr:hypothetical protein [Caballeronia sp. Lep1P3]
MKATAAIAGALLALASTASFAQEMTRDQLNQRPQTQQGQASASPTPGSNDASQGGTTAGTSGSGTLMQKREQGMSPDSSAAPGTSKKSTGQIKQ